MSCFPHVVSSASGQKIPVSLIFQEVATVTAGISVANGAACGGLVGCTAGAGAAGGADVPGVTGCAGIAGGLVMLLMFCMNEVIAFIISIIWAIISWGVTVESCCVSGPGSCGSIRLARLWLGLSSTELWDASLP